MVQGVRYGGVWDAWLQRDNLRQVHTGRRAALGLHTWCMLKCLGPEAFGDVVDAWYDM